MAKSIRIFWSQAAIVFAANDFVVLERRLISEVTDIVAKANDWFLHVVSRDNEAGRHMLICRGREDQDAWLVAVQLGEHRQLAIAAGELSFLDELGVKPSEPLPIERDDNERFFEPLRNA